MLQFFNEKILQVLPYTITISLWEYAKVLKLVNPLNNYKFLNNNIHRCIFARIYQSENEFISLDKDFIKRYIWSFSYCTTSDWDEVHIHVSWTTRKGNTPCRYRTCSHRYNRHIGTLQVILYHIANKTRLRSWLNFFIIIIILISLRACRNYSPFVVIAVKILVNCIEILNKYDSIA